MDSPHIHSTPLNNKASTNYSRSKEPGHSSLANEFRVRVGQYRAAIVEDMAHKAVRLEIEEFVTHLLKAPGPFSSDTRPTLNFIPFESIANAADMLESEISTLFVVNKHDLAPDLKMALSEYCADKGDSENQKIDAAFFHPGFIPTDGRPHWGDQMVPVEFKAHGTANDPYDDRQPTTVDAHAQTRKQVCGQIIHYAEKIFEYQLLN
ncbi:hypothetical protein BN946_scf184962.g37 [Trametes cinnabarina]|uniref:Uncharacterized protein n=1 Tax=Pycnoporus cinnabarinus TaxID=5643 RepID=A0A060SIN0_PYCCI|nr:hypothetical protein BN946_scf184962.g37 [Trametes cinnabarina]